MKGKFWCFVFVALLANAAFSDGENGDERDKRDISSIKSSTHKEKKRAVKVSEKKRVKRTREFKAKMSSIAKPIKGSGGDKQSREDKK